MRVDRLKASAVAELESELAALRAEKAALESKTPEDLWLTDLDVFSVAYDAFHTARMNRRTAVGKGTPVKVKKPAKKAVTGKAAAALGGSSMVLVS
jgi:hypothetical protein